MSRFLSDTEARELRTVCRECTKLVCYVPEEKREVTPEGLATRFVISCPEGHELVVGIGQLAR